MLDLYEEFATLIRALEGAGIPYAVCGGLAMAIHGFPRATVDVDLLVPPESLDALLAVARGLGYTLAAEPMHLARGTVEIRRVSKVDAVQKDLLSLDLLLVTDAVESAWSSRERFAWEGGQAWVTSRQGLIALKRLRGSGQDQDDIRKLEDSR
jgi:hypothetical protein